MAVAISVSAEVAGAETPVLPEVTVVDTPIPGPPVEQTTAGPVKGYQALTATSATRTATPSGRDSTVHPGHHAAADVRSEQPYGQDALRNVSGVQGTNPLQTPAYDSTYIRGFAAEQWIDGLTTYYNPGNRDSLINAERIEVLKGPSGDPVRRRRWLPGGRCGQCRIQAADRQRVLQRRHHRRQPQLLSAVFRRQSATRTARARCSSG